MRDTGLEVEGQVGHHDPIAAVDDMWDPKRFDEVIVSTLPGAASKWLQVDLPHRVARMTGVQVTHVIASDRRAPEISHAAGSREAGAPLAAERPHLGRRSARRHVDSALRTPEKGETMGFMDKAKQAAQNAQKEGGLLDKAKQAAQQAQEKLDETQKNFNKQQAESGAPPAGGPAVEYDKHGRPIQQDAPAEAPVEPAATGAPPAQPADAPPAAAPAPAAPPADQAVPGSEEPPPPARRRRGSGRAAPTAPAPPPAPPAAAPDRAGGRGRRVRRRRR